MCIILRSKCAYHERYTHSDLIEKKKCQCHKKSKSKFEKLWDELEYSEKANQKIPTCQNQPLSAVEVQAPLCCNDSIKSCLKLAWIVMFMIQAKFSRLLCFHIYYVHLKLNN